MTPNEIIIDFIRKQPEQIRDSITAGFAMIGDRSVLGVEPGEAFYQIAYDAIDRGGTYGKAMAAAAAIGLIDFYFSKPPLSPPALAAYADAQGNEMLKSVARKMELTNAYNARAQTEWMALRRSTLSLEALAEYESSLGRP